jgi:hypothetical protein
MLGNQLPFRNVSVVVASDGHTYVAFAPGLGRGDEEKFLIK